MKVVVWAGLLAGPGERCYSLLVQTVVDIVDRLNLGTEKEVEEQEEGVEDSSRGDGPEP